MFIKELPPDDAIAALLPEYTPEGDATRVLCTDGSAFLYPRTLRATLRAVARRRCKDLSLLRRWAARYTHRTLNNPIAASADLVLAPVKARTPRIPGDETMAAVNVAAHPAPRADARAVIRLAGGAALASLWSAETTLAHLAAARGISSELIRAEEEAVLRRLSRRQR
ncbi:MAG: hypothetical protein IJU05_09255 [Schwartzia sp.]|nr:hypothetical protein [Schwartzia sp. (in: firmicutes)]